MDREGADELTQTAADLVPQVNALWALVSGVGGAAGAILLRWRQDRREDRREQRETGDQLVTATLHLVEQQRAELGRYQADAAVLMAQVQQLRDGRLALQDAYEAWRDTLLAGRTMLHEAERRLGAPETVFPPLPAPIAGARAPPAA